jgi:hypothetical protein
MAGNLPRVDCLTLIFYEQFGSFKEKFEPACFSLRFVNCRLNTLELGCCNFPAAEVRPRRDSLLYELRHIPVTTLHLTLGSEINNVVYI